MDGNSPTQTAEAAKVTAEQRTAPAGTTSAELVKYVLVELDVPRENHAEFQRKMSDLVELMFDHARWELVFASYPITGIVNRFVHIWKIPNESTLVEIMRDGAFKLDTAALPEAGSLDALFRLGYTAVQELVVRTSHTLMTSLPYDPTHVGFQTQTILVDVEGETFLLDHKNLRAAAKRGLTGLRDISDDLEQVRRTKFTRRTKQNDELPKDEQAAERVASLGRRVGSLEEVQKHLNRGSTVARVTVEGKHALLFNLASLKAKSVFQAVELKDPEKPLNLGTLGGANGTVDMPVERLLIAMPWGGVYDLDKHALKQLIKAIPTEKAPATAAALAPILEGCTPIAAIPSERDDVIGDGCACYVINLQSFKCR